MKNEKGTCTVIKREVTSKEIKEILQSQKNINSINDRASDADAFEVALDGSKAYLQAHGYLED